MTGAPETDGTGDDGTRDRARRRVGLEQEFFVVDEEGRPSDRTDELLDLCGEASDTEGTYGPACYAPEFVKGLVEVSTPPAFSFEDLEEGYLRNLRTASSAARSLGLRLYPLGTYPLPLDPSVRGDADYEIQVNTIGPEAFVHAGRCAGAHVHLELAPATVDPAVGVSPAATAAAREEAVNVHNLATALDPALISLTRSCPFYEGLSSALAPRTVRYRGSRAFGWEGVYTNLPEVGALLPYAESVGHLAGQQSARYEAWLRAMDRAGVARRLFSEAGGDLLRPAWNPVRLNRQGTVELRGMDSNLPDKTLNAVALIVAAADRVRREGLAVTPDDGVGAFEVAGDRLLVPGFDLLGGDLLRAAVTGGAGDPLVAGYLDSVLAFAAGNEHPTRGRLLALLRPPRGEGYRTTEAGIRDRYPTPDGRISQGDGLRLVREACDELESQASARRL